MVLPGPSLPHCFTVVTEEQDEQPAACLGLVPCILLPCICLDSWPFISQLFHSTWRFSFILPEGVVLKVKQVYPLLPVCWCYIDPTLPVFEHCEVYGFLLYAGNPCGLPGARSCFHIHKILLENEWRWFFICLCYCWGKKCDLERRSYSLPMNVL